MKSVLVTGASTGIGYTTATTLAKSMLVFAGVRSQSDYDALAAAGGNLVPLFLEVTDRASIASAKAVVAERTGGTLDALVNNAGIVVAAPLEVVEPDEFRRQFDVNVNGPLNVTQAFLPMIRAAKGRIVTIGSIAGKCALPFMGPYSASKFAVEAFSDSLRLELEPFGVKVILVEPGAIKTPLWKRGESASMAALERLSPDSLALYGDRITKMQALSAKIESGSIPPERVAAVVERALTSRNPKARYLVGTDARVQLAVARLPEPLRDRILGSLMR